MKSQLFALLLLLLYCCCCVRAFLPAQNPSWPAPGYAMRQSTMAMIMNVSGLYDAHAMSQYAVASVDWSNAKVEWARAQPMNCSQMLVEQAREAKLRRPDQRVFVYRNLVKALPWLRSVRRKLEDERYASWFLPFLCQNTTTKLAESNCAMHVPECTDDKCSALYHDQEQTPHSGLCGQEECDCGASLPCGEYLFDHRNGTMLRDWLVNEYVLGDDAIGSPYVDGLFIDDFWCSAIINGTANCTDPVQGPSEIDSHSQEDMGLSDLDIAELTKGWLSNMRAVQQAIVDARAYTWSLLPGQANANAQPLIVNATNCAALLSDVCAPRTQPRIDFARVPLLMGMSPPHGNSNSTALPYLTQQLAAFLLMRGPYAWIGWGVWGMEWNFPKVPMPPVLFQGNFGEPQQARCERVAATNLFQRRWSNGVVQLDCDTFQATLPKYTLTPPSLQTDSRSLGDLESPNF
jgi:hypothetical protein